MSFDKCNQEGSWNELKLGDEVYMICAMKENEKFSIFLTNLVELWVEVLTKDDIIQRCRELNKLLNIDMLDCNELVGTIFNDICNHIVEANKEKIQLHKKIEDITLKFALYLRKASLEEFWEIITKPVCISSMELLRQHRLLLDLIKKKDEEIAEYKAEGAELIRKNIETKPFNEEHLKMQCHSQDKPNYSNMFQGIISFYNNHDLSKYALEGSTVSTRLIEPHFPTYCKTVKTKKALRNCVVCTKNNIRRRSRYQCEDCDVGLCVVPCFKIYHRQINY